MATFISGRLLPLILFVMCSNCWKKSIFAAYSIRSSVYASLFKLFDALNMKNVTLTVNDNNFDSEKETILYNMIEKSKIYKFTFNNLAG
jgi:hypothetical protein